jgi:hypothetical protein
LANQAADSLNSLDRAFVIRVENRKLINIVSNSHKAAHIIIAINKA